LTAAGIIWGVGAEIFYPFVEQAGESMVNPNLYIEAVLREVV
jgi:multicomponent Na+:H+ antiporter subunit D